MVTEYPLSSSIVTLLHTIGINQTSVHLMPVQLHAIIFSLFGSLIAPFGGFFASAMKRAYGIKDFSSLFPGHGGMTDRMDCQFIMGLFVYVYYTAFLHLSTYDYASIASNINQFSIEDQTRLYEQLGKSLGKF